MRKTWSIWLGHTSFEWSCLYVVLLLAYPRYIPAKKDCTNRWHMLAKPSHPAGNLLPRERENKRKGNVKRQGKKRERTRKVERNRKGKAKEKEKESRRKAKGKQKERKRKEKERKGTRKGKGKGKEILAGWEGFRHACAICLFQLSPPKCLTINFHSRWHIDTLLRVPSVCYSIYIYTQYRV